MKICLFSSYSTSLVIDNYIIFYLKELLRFHNQVIFITNERKVSVILLDKLGIKTIFVKNEGYDFGMWYKVLKTLDINTITRLSLINDSCVLFSKLNNIFKKVKNSDFDYCGITKSIDFAEHIQSYFLVIKKPIIKHVYNYFMDNGIYEDLQTVILKYEIGLSQHLIKRGFKIGPLFNLSKSFKGNNTSVYLAKELIENGCPLIKKKVLLNSFKDDETLVLHKTKYEFDFDYIDLIKNKNPIICSFGFKKTTIEMIESNDFDWKYYINTYIDLRNAGILTEKAALEHYNKFGKKEGRKISENQIIKKS